MTLSVFKLINVDCNSLFSATCGSANWTGEISKPNVLEVFKGNFKTFQIDDD